MLGPTHSLNRMLISKETFKKQHLPQFELESLWQITAVLGRWLSTCLQAVWEYSTAARLWAIKDFKRREKKKNPELKINWEGISTAKHHWHPESCWRCHTEVHPTRAFAFFSLLFFLFCFLFFSRRRIDRGEQGLLHDSLCCRQTASSSELLLTLSVFYFFASTRKQGAPGSDPSPDCSELTIQRQKSRGDL